MQTGGCADVIKKIKGNRRGNRCYYEGDSHLVRWDESISSVGEHPALGCDGTALSNAVEERNLAVIVVVLAVALVVVSMVCVCVCVCVCVKSRPVPSRQMKRTTRARVPQTRSRALCTATVLRSCGHPRAGCSSD
jgi:hypothetical protein